MADFSIDWKKFFSWLGQVAAGLTVVTILIAAIIYVIHAETGDLRHDLSTLKENVQELKTDVGKTNERIDRALTDALNKLVSAAKSRPRGSKATLETGEQIISIAKSVNAKLDPKVLAEFGNWASNQTSDPAVSPVAWKSLTEAVNYRSFLNVNYAPKLSDLTPWPENDQYRQSLNVRPHESGAVSARPLTVYFAGGHQPPDKSARLETLSRPQQQGSGIGMFVIEGDADFIVLDGMYMKNVILRNARVIYEGGPVRLESVYFVNCTFVLKQAQPTRRLGGEILQAESVNFLFPYPA